MNTFSKDIIKEVGPKSLTLATANFMSRVYWWMTLGILLTGLVAYEAASSPTFMQFLVSSKWAFMGLIVVQLGTVVLLSALIQKMHEILATMIYLAYAALTGLTLATIFLVYTNTSITSAFAVTAISFWGLSMFGYITKRDLGPVGSFCMMGLFGLIGVIILSIFVPSLMNGVGQIVISIVGIIVFAGLTAYDTQKIKALSLVGGAVGVVKKNAIFGALMLYLDFINLFINILRLMGERK